MEWLKTLLGLTSNISDLTQKLDIQDKTRTLKRKMETLACREIDIHTQLDVEEKRPGKKRKEEVYNWSNRYGSLRTDVNGIMQKVATSTSLWQLTLGPSLDKLIREAEQLHEDGRFPEGLTLDVDKTQGCEIPVEELVGQAFQSNLEKIWDYLVSEEVQCIGIQGMGGVGKTTLVMHIHNKIVKNRVTFESSCWVTVSQDCNIRKLQEAIAEHLHLDLRNENDEKIRSGRLWKVLSGRKFVIILDDIWEYYPLKKVGIPLERNGCKLILTSRKKDVCYQMNCDKLVEVATLPEQEAWHLFCDNLKSGSLLSPDVEEIAQAVARECAGLPLGIVVLSGIMRGVTDIYEWRITLKELKESKFRVEHMEDKVFRILRFSYHRLNDSILQQCFLHIALYPEDYIVSKFELTQYFIDTGIIERGGISGEEFDKSNTILNKLIKSCLLEESSKFPSHGVKMHDLVRDMGINITNGRFMVKAGQRLRDIPDEREWVESLEKVSLMNNKIKEITPDVSPQCPNISTLFLQGNPLLAIPHSFFRHMQALQVLNLSETDIEELPDSFSYLENLIALHLSGCLKLRSVPSLAKMRALRTLMLDKSGIEEIPEGMERLRSLIYLNLQETKGLKARQWPTQILPQLSHLQHLNFNQGPKIVKAEELMSLNKLESLHCWFDDIDEFITCMRYLQGGTSHVNYCCISSGASCPSHSLVFEDMMQRRVTGGMYKRSSSLDLKVVAIVNCNMEGRSESFQLPNDLFSFHLEDCQGVTSMSQWGMTFPKLAHLFLSNLGDLRAMISNSPQPAMTAGNDCFFSNLRYLTISGCPRIKKLLTPRLLPLLTNMKVIKVSECEELEEIIAVEDDNCDDATLGLPNLWSMELQGLSQLKRVCGVKQIMKCDSLWKLHILDCPKLERIPIEFHIPSSHHQEDNPVPPSLESVRISSVPGWSDMSWYKGLRYT